MSDTKQKNEVSNLTTAEFDEYVGQEGLTVVDFWASWCGPCIQMAPQFEKAAASLEPSVRLAKVNTDEQQALAGRYGIQGIPTLVLIHQGREVARRSGAMSAAAIESWVRGAIG